MVAKNKTRTTPKTLNITIEDLGRYLGSLITSHNQKTKRTSIKILKTKFLPVMNGKKRERVTTRGKIGTVSNPILMIQTITLLSALLSTIPYIT